MSKDADVHGEQLGKTEKKAEHLSHEVMKLLMIDDDLLIFTLW